MKKLCIVFIMLVFSVYSAVELYGQAIQLKNSRELFIDDFLIESTQNIDHHLSVPQTGSGGLKFDKPWEGKFVTYVSIIDNGQKFQMYYRGKGMVDNKDIEVTCYAESMDGIHWTKPNLGLHTIGDSKMNNVILVNDDKHISHNFSVYFDSNPDVPKAERYKAVGGVSHGNGERIGLTRLVSEDGIHWKPFHKTETLFKEYALDSHNVLTWVPSENCFAVYLRTWTGAKPGMPYPPKSIRTIARSTSKDFIHWTEPVPMTFGDTEIEHLYTNATHPYFRAPQILISMPFRFSPKLQLLSEAELIRNGVDKSQWKGVADGIFMTSRGGNQYDRKFLESFIRPGLNSQNWSARSNIPALGVIPTGENEMSLYVTRHYGSKDVALERMVLRKDGFASLKANFESGSIVTKPMKLDGNKLRINMSTSPIGYVQVVLLDENNKEIPGFGESEAIHCIGDDIDYEVVWENEKSIADLKNRTVKMKIIMKDAELYAFSVTDN